MAITFQEATLADVALLAEMNRQLIEDEGSRNPMTLPQLEARLRGWLGGEMQLLLALVEGQVVGYVVYRVRADEYFPDQREIYVRQFFIQRDRRRQRLGQAVFAQLTDERFPRGARLTLDVLTDNMRGAAFWRKVGLRPAMTTLAGTTEGIADMAHGQPAPASIPPLDQRFWEHLDTLLAAAPLILDRPRGSHHPRYPDLVYPLDYGYLAGTSSMDSSGIDVWVGSAPEKRLVAVICTVDLHKSDSEIKLLLGCTPAEQRLLLAFHNDGTQAATLVIR